MRKDIRKRKIKKRSYYSLKGIKDSVTGITLIALVITIVLNSSYLAMERKNRKEANKLKI